MLALRRRVFASLIALAVFLLVIHLNFRPFTAYKFHSVINATNYAQDLFRNKPGSSGIALRYAIRKLIALVSCLRGL